ASILSDQRLLALLGSRLLAELDVDAPDSFRDLIAADVARNQARGLALEALSAELAARLDADEVPVLVLKGPLMARRLHGDVGLRASNDVDLLVNAEDLPRAASALEPLGYAKANDTVVRSHGLPDMHDTLKSTEADLPRIELHWRVHWYEEEFSRELLARSRPDTAGLRQPAPADELAMLLLVYARDGLYGLRAPADIAAWWARHGEGARPLDDHWTAHPRLRRPLAAAAIAADRVVGVPARALVPERALGWTTPRLAARLANWSQVGDLDQLAANLGLVDALLSPPAELRHFVRRRLYVSRREIEDMYDLKPSARLRVGAMRLVHAPKLALRYAAGLWGARRLEAEPPSQPTTVSAAPG
ncbi:MAG: hypothetical protein QOJ01_1364, partial [Solirubrobacterales bacterium]|nr:hypothetical protein [Solirubrobacterales bacterium]